MDSYSGSCQQNFIPFCLDMSSENVLSKSTFPGVDGNDSATAERQETAERVDLACPLS